MTLEQLSIFVGVTEGEHLTQAAEAIRLGPAAVTQWFSAKGPLRALSK